MNILTIRMLLAATFLLYGFSKGQETGEYISYYEFGLCNAPQTVVLKHLKDGTYSTTINTLFKKKGTDLDILVETTKFPDHTKEMISKLKAAGIDSVNETYNDEGASYLDGDALSVKILRNNRIESFAFPELYPSSQEKAETTPLRLKVQSWLEIINREENLKEHFSNVKKSLKRGHYCYNMGTDTVCFKKK